MKIVQTPIFEELLHKSSGEVKAIASAPLIVEPKNVHDLRILQQIVRQIEEARGELVAGQRINTGEMCFIGADGKLYAQGRLMTSAQADFKSIDVKPPKHQRCIELLDIIERCMKAGAKPRQVWFEELREAME